MARTEQAAWKLLTLGSAALAGIGTRKALGGVWSRVRHESPPDDPSDREPSWSRALAWAVAVGVGVGVARLLALRLSSAAWQRATGEPPPPRT